QEELDLVLLDVMMPKMSGYEVCRLIRERHSLQQLPVIFLTAKNQVSDLVEAYSVGANDFLAKPVAKSELLARVRPHLDLLAIHRRLEDLVTERMAQVKVLRGMLPICARCKRIRDDGGYWNQLEIYIDRHSEATFSHGFCPECAQEYYNSIPQPPGVAGS
ncbi:MAG: response regulator, partial [bacterium]|nr:response regulator [bacterium]